MKDMEINSPKKAEWNFTWKKFLHTGRELVVEVRGSLHTGRGRWGLAAFLVGVFVGIYKALTATDIDNRQNFLLIGTLWSAMGLVMMLNLQNHKLMYLLPISRKEFAAGQIRKMIWICLMILGIIAVQFACMNLGVKDFWRNLIWKGIPTSLSLSACQIASMEPVRGSRINGTRMYGLSFMVLVLDLGLAFLNLLFVADSWNMLDKILPILNYGMSIYGTVYFYRKIAFADLYYDEL